MYILKIVLSFHKYLQLYLIKIKIGDMPSPPPPKKQKKKQKNSTLAPLKSFPSCTLCC